MFRNVSHVLSPADHNVQSGEGAIFKLDQGFLIEL
jgi:hypothetical protein